jgi:hypothetical protein
MYVNDGLTPDTGVVEVPARFLFVPRASPFTAFGWPSSGSPARPEGEGGSIAEEVHEDRDLCTRSSLSDVRGPKLLLIWNADLFRTPFYMSGKSK